MKKLFLFTLIACMYTYVVPAQSKDILSENKPLTVNTTSAKSFPAISNSEVIQPYSDAVYLTKIRPDKDEKKHKHYILKGILIGGAIGLAPIVFGEGGAYVAVFSFPLGLIVGGIVGNNTRKKHKND